MKITLLITFIALLSSCGTRTEQVTVQGTPGQDGYSIVTKTISDPQICGTAGGTTVYLALDTNRNQTFDSTDSLQTQFVTCNGQRGQNGTNGANGLAGTSCTVNKIGNASTVTCGNSTAVILDGLKGDTGATGAQGPSGTNASGISITEIINPCGEEYANDEVFLRLSNGRILSLYDGGANEDRLALLAPGYILPPMQFKTSLVLSQ